MGGGSAAPEEWASCHWDWGERGMDSSSTWPGGQAPHTSSLPHTAFSPQTFLMQFTSSVYHWIGLTDRGTEGHWRWTDGTAFDRARSRA